MSVIDRPGASRRADIRHAAYFNIGLGGSALLAILLASDRQAAFLASGFAGIGLILWGAVQAWAAMGHDLRGTKLLAMFMAILGLVILGSSFLIADEGPYRYATIIIGALVFGVSVVDAVISPDEDRRRRFEPRRPQDAAPPP